MSNKVIDEPHLKMCLYICCCLFVGGGNIPRVYLQLFFLFHSIFHRKYQLVVQLCYRWDLKILKELEACVATAHTAGLFHLSVCMYEYKVFSLGDV